MPQHARVAVVEDDPDMRLLVADVLRHDGHHVIELPDGAALRHELAHPSGPSVDLVVSDVRMPGVSGVAMLRTMRELGDTRPVVLMTAFADDAVRSQANLLGAVVFTKPFHLNDLRSAVRSLLGARGR
jgi:two-component system response regulator (stage 0 sporulation protein F)